MFEKLLHLNIANCSEAELVALLMQTHPVAAFHLQVTQELTRRFDNGCSRTIPAPAKAAHLVTTAIANGRSHFEKMQNVNEDKFDVILDTTTNSLKFRKDPTKHTPLKESKLAKIGGHRIRLLAYMLEHPGSPFYCGNIYTGYDSSEEKRGPNTFTKSISALRNAFEQKDTNGPYIIKQFDWDGVTRSVRGYIYKINPNWRYLVIRHNDKISHQIQV